jgi:hypothetical protein
MIGASALPSRSEVHPTLEPSTPNHKPSTLGDPRTLCQSLLYLSAPDLLERDKRSGVTHLSPGLLYLSAEPKS